MVCRKSSHQDNIHYMIDWMVFCDVSACNGYIYLKSNISSLFNRSTRKSPHQIWVHIGYKM